MNYREAVEYLDSHRYTGIKPGLEGMEFLCQLLDEPQRHVPGIHVTGTNGKGSTVRMAAAVLAAGGLSVGTFTSPYLQVVNEIVTLDGRPLSNEAFADLMTELAPYLDHMRDALGRSPTYFEVKTALAFTAFAGRAVAVAVVEVGMGGRWDTTNVFDGAVAVLTNVALDHVNYLGPDRLAIAAEKVGIVKPGAVAVVGERDPDVHEVAARRCDEVGADLWLMGRDFDVEEQSVAVGGQVVSLRTPAGVYRDLFLPLHGAHQAENAACALAALEAFHGGALSEALVREGFEGVRSPGRLEVVGRQPLVVLDVAHNPHGASALAAALPETFAYDEKVVVVGILEGKDRLGMLPHVVPGARVVATAADDPHSVPAEVLGKEAKEAGAMSVDVVPRVPDAVDRARAIAGSQDLVLITGSHYSVGEARTHLLGPGPAV